MNDDKITGNRTFDPCKLNLSAPFKTFIFFKVKHRKKQKAEFPLPFMNNCMRISSL